MKAKTPFALLIAGVLLWAPVTVSAHHSTSMFDGEKDVMLNGTVTSWAFVKPHSWVQVTVTDSDGKETLWAIETLGAGPIHKNSFKVGEKVAAIINPMRDGRAGGILVEVVTESGEEWAREDRERQLSSTSLPQGSSTLQ